MRVRIFRNLEFTGRGSNHWMRQKSGMAFSNASTGMRNACRGGCRMSGRSEKIGFDRLSKYGTN